MRVIFLDIDGVLVTEASMRFWQAEITAGRGPNEDWMAGEYFCPTATANFRWMLDHLPPDVRLVLSSTWRIGRHRLGELKAIFDERGLDSSRVIGRTGEIEGNTCRGVEIYDWLLWHPDVHEFVVLDDDRDMLMLLPSLAQTNFADGLTMPLAEQIVGFFGEPGTAPPTLMPEWASRL